MPDDLDASASSGDAGFKLKSLKHSTERDAIVLRPKEELAESIAEAFGLESAIIPNIPKTHSWKPGFDWRAPAAERSIPDLEHDGSESEKAGINLDAKLNAAIAAAEAERASRAPRDGRAPSERQAL